MTIDEIKQALREMKEMCANTIECSECPFAVGKIKHCPVTTPHGDAIPPCEWRLDWTEDTTIAKPAATEPLAMNDYQRMARRTAGTKRKSDKMDEALFGLAGEVGELCDHYKKHKHQGHELNYDHMARKRAMCCGIWRRSPTRLA